MKSLRAFVVFNGITLDMAQLFHVLSWRKGPSSCREMENSRGQDRGKESPDNATLTRLAFVSVPNFGLSLWFVRLVSNFGVLTSWWGQNYFVAFSYYEIDRPMESIRSLAQRHIEQAGLIGVHPYFTNRRTPLHGCLLLQLWSTCRWTLLCLRLIHRKGPEDQGEIEEFILMNLLMMGKTEDDKTVVFHWFTVASSAS